MFLMLCATMLISFGLLRFVSLVEKSRHSSIRINLGMTREASSLLTLTDCGFLAISRSVPYSKSAGGRLGMLNVGHFGDLGWRQITPIPRAEMLKGCEICSALHLKLFK